MTDENNIYTRGDTIRLVGTFTTFDGDLADPDTGSVSLKIYDSNETLIETKTGSEITKDSTGVYYYDYLLPADGDYIYEWSGVLESNIELARSTFSVTFTG